MEILAWRERRSNGTGKSSRPHCLSMIRSNTLPTGRRRERRRERRLRRRAFLRAVAHKVRLCVEVSHRLVPLRPHERARAAVGDAVSLAMPTTSPRFPVRSTMVSCDGSFRAAETVRASSAIICSSSVGITRAAIRLSAASISVAFASIGGGIVDRDAEPSQSVGISASRICGWCSPMPAVKTMPSSPPSVVASARDLACDAEREQVRCLPGFRSSRSRAGRGCRR